METERSNPRTLKWKSIYFVSNCISRVSGLISSRVLSSGSTALHHAVIRGDLEVVNILLTAGADPFVRNGLGLDCFSLCEIYGPFPNLENALIANVDIMDLAGKVGLKRVHSMIAKRTGDIDTASLTRNKKETSSFRPERPSVHHTIGSSSILSDDDEEEQRLIDEDDLESH